MFLAYGNDYKGIWSLSIVPDSSLRPFVRGVHSVLWLMLVVVPNVVCLFVLAWSWGVWWDAVFFIAYSTVAASLYLGVGLKLVDGVPFGKQTPPDRNADMIGITLIYLRRCGYCDWDPVHYLPFACGGGRPDSCRGSGYVLPDKRYACWLSNPAFGSS